MKKANSDPDGKDSQSNNVGGVYYNQLTGRSETAIKFEDLNNFKATHGKEFYQEQFDVRQL